MPLHRPVVRIKVRCIKNANREFPGGPVVRTPHFHCRGPRFDSLTGQGTKILQAARRGQKKNRMDEITLKLFALRNMPTRVPDTKNILNKF